MTTVTVRGKPIKPDYVAELEPTGKAGIRGPFYRVVLDGEEIVGSAVNGSLDACRVLKERGLSGMIGFRHTDGMIGMVMSIDWGAAHTVEERATGSPRFAKWRERPQIGPETSAVEP